MISKTKEGRMKMVVGLMCMALALFGLTYEAAAVDKDELEAEIEKIAAQDPELAREMQHELESAIREGEIEVEHQAEGRAVEIDWETPEGRTQAVSEIDSHKEDLLKQGLTESDVDKLKELVSTGDHDPEKFKEIFEKDGRPVFEGGREGEFFKEGMERGEYGREMMERMMREVAGREEGDRMREFGMEREMTVKEQADKETFEHAMREGDRETMERMMKEYEGRDQGDREAMEREMREHGEFEREMMERGEREFGEREFAEREFAEREAFEREYMEREFERPSPGEYREPPPGFEPPREMEPPPPQP